MLAYVGAKMLVYTILGLVVLTLGQRLINALLPYVDWMRKLIGPLMIVLGLAVLGVFRFRFQAGQGLARRLEREASSVDRRERALEPKQVRVLGEATRPRQSLVPATALATSGSIASSAGLPSSEGAPVTLPPSPLSSFLLGLGFSLAFCPTLFLLFFGITMTLAARSAGGFAFPAIFALGATLPLLLLVGLTLTGSGAARRVRRGWRSANRPLRWLGAAILIFFGLHDTLIYWFI
jgi:cytochrome c-type biogenesis protein